VVYHSDFDSWFFPCYPAAQTGGTDGQEIHLTLTDTAWAHLLTLIKQGQVSARKLSRAHTLLQADAGATDEAIAAALHLSIATVERIRKHFVEEGLRPR
jgi:hypothetical protein